MIDPTQAQFSLAYVMTHYPRVALTYIAGEIDEIERRGGEILPIAMNPPAQEDLTTDCAQRRRQRSIYLKNSPMRIVSAMLAAAVKNPIKMAALAIAGVRSARGDIGITIRRLVHLGYAALVAKDCRNRDIRHVHAQFGLAPATIAWFACQILNFDGRTGATWSFTIHGFHDFVNEAESRLDLKAASASFVVCISDFTKSQLCRITDPQYWSRFHVVRCGIDLSAFAQREPRPPRAVPQIVTVGRLSPEKGHGILLEAVSALAKEDVPIEVVFIGDGPFGEEIRKLAAKLGIEKNVILTGELLPDEVAKRLTDADGFCMASFAEGLPISIMEAMAVGVPVVSTWIGGIPELAQDGVTALTVPPANSGELAAAIKRIVEDSELRDRITSAGRAAVERMHSRESNGAKLEKLFRNIIISAAAA